MAFSCKGDPLKNDKEIRYTVDCAVCEVEMIVEEGILQKQTVRGSLDYTLISFDGSQNYYVKASTMERKQYMKVTLYVWGKKKDMVEVVADSTYIVASYQR